MDERRPETERLSSTSTSTTRDPTPNAQHPTPETGPEADTSRLLALVRHEFGQPLTVIQGFSELIQEGNLSPEEVKEYAAEIFKEATHLAEMVARLRVG